MSSAAAKLAGGLPQLNKGASPRPKSAPKHKHPAAGGAAKKMAMVPRYADGGVVEDLEEGGEVEGPGGPTDDQVPAMLSPGEIVIPADVVEAIGADALLALIDQYHEPSGQPAMKDGIEAHADGGEIQRNGNAYSALSTIGPNASFSGGSAGGVTGDGSISDQSQTAAQRMSDTSTASSVLAAQQPAQGYQPSSAAIAMSTLPQQSPALGDWTQRNAMRSAQVQSSSIDPRTSAEGRQAMATLTGVGQATDAPRGTPRAQAQQAMAQLPGSPAAATPQPVVAPQMSPAQQMSALTRADSAIRGSSPMRYGRPQVPAYADGGMVLPEDENNAIRNAATAMSTLPTRQQPVAAPMAPVSQASPAAPPAQFQKPSAAQMLASVAETNASNPASPPVPQVAPAQMAQDSWSARKAMQNAETTASSIHKPTAQRGQAEIARLEKQNAQENAINSDLATSQMKEAGLTGRTRMQEAWAARRAAAQEQAAAGLAVFRDQGETSRTKMREEGDDRRAVLAALSKDARRSGAAPSGYQWAPDGISLMPIPGGPATVDKPTEDQAKARGWLTQAGNAYKNMNEVLGEHPEAAKPELIPELVRKIPGMESAAHAITSPERQQFSQAASSFSEAVLRAATGAGITKDEAAQKIAELTPQLGDKPSLVKQKLESQAVYLKSLAARTGGNQATNIHAEDSAKTPATPERKVKRYGVHSVDGRRVVEYSDGGIDYAD